MAPRCLHLQLFILFFFSLRLSGEARWWGNRREERVCLIYWTNSDFILNLYTLIWIPTFWSSFSNSLGILKRKIFEGLIIRCHFQSLVGQNHLSHHSCPFLVSFFLIFLSNIISLGNQPWRFRHPHWGSVSQYSLSNHLSCSRTLSILRCAVEWIPLLL